MLTSHLCSYNRKKYLSDSNSNFRMKFSVSCANFFFAKRQTKIVNDEKRMNCLAKVLLDMTTGKLKILCKDIEKVLKKYYINKIMEKN